MVWKELKKKKRRKALCTLLRDGILFDLGGKKAVPLLLAYLSCDG